MRPQTNHWFTRFHSFIDEFFKIAPFRLRCVHNLPQINPLSFGCNHQKWSESTMYEHSKHKNNSFVCVSFVYFASLHLFLTLTPLLLYHVVFDTNWSQAAVKIIYYTKWCLEKRVDPIIKRPTMKGFARGEQWNEIQFVDSTYKKRTSQVVGKTKSGSALALFGTVNKGKLKWGLDKADKSLKYGTNKRRSWKKKLSKPVLQNRNLNNRDRKEMVKQRSDDKQVTGDLRLG